MDKKGFLPKIIQAITLGAYEPPEGRTAHKLLIMYIQYYVSIMLCTGIINNICHLYNNNVGMNVSTHNYIELSSTCVKKNYYISASDSLMYCAYLIHSFTH